MPTSALSTERSTMLAADCLADYRHWIALRAKGISPVQITDVEKFVLRQFFKLNGVTPDHEESFCRHLVVSQVPINPRILCDLFWIFSTVLCQQTRIIFEQAGIMFGDGGGQKVQFCITPAFLYPTDCLLCGKHFPELNGTNFSSESTKLRRLHCKACRHRWDTIKKTFNRAFMGVNEILQAQKNYEMAPVSDEKRGLYFDLMEGHRPFIQKAFELTWEFYFNVRNLPDWPYRPRYELSKFYVSGKTKRFVAMEGIVTEEHYSDILVPGIVGKYLTPYVNAKGVACGFDGKPIKGVNPDNVVAFSGLEDFLRDQLADKFFIFNPPPFFWSEMVGV